MPNNPRLMENLEVMLLRELQAGAKEPTELVEKLAKRNEEKDICREVIMRLLADKRIYFDKDWNLQLAKPARGKCLTMPIGVVRCSA